MMTPSIAFTLALAMTPPGSTCRAPALSAEQASLARGHATALRDAEAQATEDPDQGIALLTAALDRARLDAQAVALDPEAADARRYAMLALARGLLGAEQRERAAAIIDSALVTAVSTPLPAKLFGPSLVALHDERKAGLDRSATATLQARCTGACLVIVDAAWVGCAGPDTPIDLALVPGSWDVLLVDAADTGRVTAERVELVASGSVEVSLEIPKLPSASRGRRAGSTGLADGGRKLPRWAGILGVAAGVVALVAGGVLVAVDGRCPDSTDPMGAGACQNILNTDAPGFAMLGVGGAALVGFAIPLGLGEAKQARARKASARWHGPGMSIRF